MGPYVELLSYRRMRGGLYRLGRRLHAAMPGAPRLLHQGRTGGRARYPREGAGGVVCSGVLGWLGLAPQSEEDALTLAMKRGVLAIQVALTTIDTSTL